jgi:hypothetical protein
MWKNSKLDISRAGNTTPENDMPSGQGEALHLDNTFIEVEEAIFFTQICLDYLLSARTSWTLGCLS